MPISVYPAPVTSTINASSVTAIAPLTIYEGRTSFDAAIYSVTCATTTIATVQFFSGSGTEITQISTVSGIISVNLASPADRIRVWTDTGTNIVVTVTKIASALSNVFSGTLDTITSSGTYTGTSASGYGYALVVGGGGNGVAFRSGGQQGGGGGGSGGVGGKVVALTGSMPVTVGGQGAASIFAGITANGGGNASGITGGTGGTVTGATITSTANGTNGYEAFGVHGGNGGMATSPYPFIANPIGVKGEGYHAYPSPTNSTPPSGYGAGSGGADTGQTPYNGRPGVVYVLRF